MPILKNCCFCISLNKGGVILGVMALVGSIVGSVAACLLLLGVLDPNKNNPNETVPWPLMAFLFGLCIISVVTSSMLIFGAVKRRKNFVIPYLVTEGLHCISGLAYLPIQIYIATQQTTTDTVPALIGSLIGLVIEVYLWICTYSLYQKIRDEMNDTHPERSPDIPYTHIH